MKRIIALAFLFSAPLFAATHWVSPTGTAIYAACSGSTPLSGTAACSISVASNNAVAGDLVYLRGGTYSNVTLAPANSGTGTSLPSNMITFEAYTGETPIITCSTVDPLDIVGVTYIRVIGITFTKTGDVPMRIERGAGHVELNNDTFNSPDGWNIELLIDGGPSNLWVTNVWIHNSTFTTSGQAHGDGGTGCTDGGGDTLDIGSGYGVYSNTTDLDNNITVENNVFNHAPHANLESYGEFTVIRGNYFHNEPWSSGCPSPTNNWHYSSSNPNYTSYNGSFGHRNMTVDNDFESRTFQGMLIEGNRSGFAGMNDSNDGADTYTLGATQNIFRYNFSYASMNPGLNLKWGWANGNGSGGNGGTYNRIYNNTFYSNGYGNPGGLTCGLSTCPWDETNISLYLGAASGTGNILKNNLMYNGAGYTHFGWDVADKGAPANGWADFPHTINNWCSGTQTGGSNDASGNSGCVTSGNPNFNNPDLSNPSSTTLPDLSLQAGSAALNGGTSLTTTTNSGTNATTMTVADALYFQDGTWGADLSRQSSGLGGTMQADQIAIGCTSSNVVRINTVTYGAYNAPAGTITLAAPATWTNGQQLCLYSKSDGAVVWQNTETNFGAGMLTTGNGGGASVPTGVSVTTGVITN